MDLLIDSLEKFNIHKDHTKFERDLENVIGSFKKLNNEWEKIKSNYSKLRYINELVDNYYIPNSENFLKSIDLFMNNLDHTIENYIYEIDWKNQKPYYIVFSFHLVYKLLYTKYAVMCIFSDYKYTISDHNM